MSPPGFKQIYVIHASLGESSVPVVFAFSERKNQATYDDLFQALQDQLNELNLNADPDTIICDFETAVIQSIENIFGDIEVQGCFYHLTQSTYRKVQDLQLVER